MVTQCCHLAIGKGNLGTRAIGDVALFGDVIVLVSQFGRHLLDFGLHLGAQGIQRDDVIGQFGQVLNFGLNGFFVCLNDAKSVLQPGG